MALRKLERSCRTPPGWRLATVQEAKDNMESIEQSNLLDEWDRACLLNGWIGGSRYDFKVEEAFRSCLGYMLLIESPTPEISHSDVRNTALYSEVPKLSEEGRSAAFLLCSQDWNEEVLKWLMPGESTEENSMSLWEGGRTEVASKVVSAVARECQAFHAKVRVRRTEWRLASLKAMMECFQGTVKGSVDEAQESLKALKIKIQESDEGNITNDILDDFLEDFREVADVILDELGLTDFLEEFEDNALDTSETSSWEAFADTVCYVFLETMYLIIMLPLCHAFYEKVLMHSEADDELELRSLASLTFYAYEIYENRLEGLGTAVEEAAKGANGDCKRFGEILCDKWTSILSSKGDFDALSILLALAAKKGNVDIIKRLTDNGVKPSKIDYKGKTALHYAAELEDESKGLEIATMLLAATQEKESLVNKGDSKNKTPLHAAADGGHAEMCKLLLQENASVTSQDTYGYTPVHYAVQTFELNEEVVRVLISAGRVEGSPPLVDIKHDRVCTPLYMALIFNAPVTMVAWLLSLSKQPESYFEDLDLPLYLRESSRLGYQDLVQKLLEGGADPFEGDDDGKTALHYAAEHAKDDRALEIVQKLLSDKKQGSPNWRKASVGDKYGRNVLHIAAFLGRKRLCRWLLDLDRKMLDTKDRDGQSAIFYAVAGTHDDPSVLDEFISRKQATNQAFAKDFSQTTPLHVAASRGNLKMVEKLLSDISEERKKVYVESTDVLGQTALHKAASGGHCEVVKILVLRRLAHPLKQRDCDGKTALHFAAQADGEKAVKVAELLLESCESDEQRSLLLFASAAGIGKPNLSLEKYLEQKKSEILKNVRILISTLQI